MSPNRAFLAGWGWWRRFKGRHPVLSRRRTELLDRKRAGALNESVVQDYFDLLSVAFAKVKELSGGIELTPERVWNLDESGISLDVGRQYVFARRGTRVQHQMSSGVREHVTAVACVSAAGFSQPPFFIFAGVRANASALAGAPAGSAMAMSPKGYMTDEVSICLLAAHACTPCGLTFGLCSSDMAEVRGLHARSHAA
jgi:hypothetical protein